MSDLTLAVVIISWVVTVGYFLSAVLESRLKKTESLVNRMLALKLIYLKAAVREVGDQPPERAHVESPAYMEWAEPHDRLEEFYKMFPEMRGK